jgi:hypothetical protein
MNKQVAGESFVSFLLDYLHMRKKHVMSALSMSRSAQKKHPSSLGLRAKTDPGGFEEKVEEGGQLFLYEVFATSSSPCVRISRCSA